MAALPDVLPAGPVELHRWRAECVDRVLAAVEASFEELHRWMPWVQTMPTRAHQEQVLADGERSFDEGTDFGYLLIEHATGDLVGGCGLHRRVGPEAIEIGYWVRSDRHNRGYATETARALTDAAFHHLHEIDRVEIHMDAGNVASARVPAKLGYTLLGEEAREILAPGHTGRGLAWAVSREAWCSAESSSTDVCG